MLKTIVYLLVTIAIVYGASHVESGGCQYDDIFVPFGEMTETPDVGKACFGIFCDDYGWMEYYGCQQQTVHPTCVVTEHDNSKPYPECCPQVVCETNKSLENPHGCQFGHIVIPFGKTKEISEVGYECLRVSCYQDGWIDYYGCADQQVPPHCSLTQQDNSKPYPDCCPQVECETTKPKECKYDGLFVPLFGTKNSPAGGNSCFAISCNENKWFPLGCLVEDTPPNCILTEQDNSKPFPDCCPQVVCETTTPQGCDNGDVFIALGETELSAGGGDICFGVSCNELGWYFLECPDLQAPLSCTLTGKNTSKPFPDCCPQVVCEESSKQEGCLYGNVVLPLGTVKHSHGGRGSNSCFGISCDEEGWFSLGCPDRKAPVNCTLTEEDISKPYPQCCPQVICERTNTKGCPYAEVILPLGTTKQSPGGSNSCFGISCDKEGWFSLGCPDREAAPNCILIEDTSKPFPHCCPQVLCETTKPAECENANAILPLGPIYSGSNTCLGISCDKEGWFPLTCTKNSTPLNCTVTSEDYSKPYPDCCSEIIC